jgi:hypothetical protein
MEGHISIDAAQARQMRRLVRLVSKLEDTEPFVDTAVLEVAFGRRRRLAASGIEQLWQLLDAAVREGILLSEPRLRLDRDQRALVPTRLYRVNYRHPWARRAVGIER